MKATQETWSKFNDGRLHLATKEEIETLIEDIQEIRNGLEGIYGKGASLYLRDTLDHDLYSLRGLRFP